MVATACPLQPNRAGMRALVDGSMTPLTACNKFSHASTIAWWAMEDGRPMENIESTMVITKMETTTLITM